MAPSTVSGRFTSKAHLPAFRGTTPTTLQYASLSMLMLCRSHKRSHINYVASNDRSWCWQPHACHKPHWTPDSIVRYSAQCLPDYSNYKPNIFLPPSSSCHNWNVNHKEILPGWGSHQMLCKVCELWDRRLWRVGPVWCVPSMVPLCLCWCVTTILWSRRVCMLSGSGGATETASIHVSVCSFWIHER